jgi:plasmid stabilization system protein ParE
MILMEIIWTQKARNSYWNNINYLEHYWNDDIADDFENETLRVLDIIEKNPHIGRYDEDFQCYIFLIVKQISLLYDLNNNQIVLLNFWDNRQKPIKRLNI